MGRETAAVMEIFTSLQGEGLDLGERQLFLRFYGCNRRCRYCDTEASLATSGPCRVELTPGRGDWLERSNPLTVEEGICFVRAGAEQKGGVHSLALTGGEPLLHVPFLRRLLPGVKNNLSIFLETNGLLYRELESIHPLIDRISMDVKLASATGEATDWEGHGRFLETGGAKIRYVKVVVTPDVEEDELSRLAELTRSGGDPPLVLQPVSGSESDRSWMGRLLAIQAGLREEGVGSVRIIPQVHKLLGVL